MDDTKLLLIDTTRDRLLVALLDGKTPEIRTNPEPRRHSEVLNTIVGDFVSRASAFAVVTGPGSWTGSRVGVVAVKAYALATGKPIVALENSPLSKGVPPAGAGDLGDDELFSLAWQKFLARDFTTPHALAPFYNAEFKITPKK